MCSLVLDHSHLEHLGGPLAFLFRSALSFCLFLSSLLPTVNIAAYIHTYPPSFISSHFTIFTFIDRHVWRNQPPNIRRHHCRLIPSRDSSELEHFRCIIILVTGISILIYIIIVDWLDVIILSFLPRDGCNNPYDESDLPNRRCRDIPCTQRLSKCRYAH